MTALNNYSFYTSSQYFTQATENAILRYVETYTGSLCDEYEYKNGIYMEYIHKPFNELIDYSIYELCYDFGTDSYNDVKQEVIVYLLEQLHLYRKEKGKAFSYFNIICRNFLKQRTKQQYRKTHYDVPIENVDINKNILNDSINKYKNADNNEFLDIFIDHIDTNLEYYFKVWAEQDVANAIIILLKNRHNLENPHKKIIYVYIKEMTDAKSHIISRVLKIIKALYLIMLNTYINTDTIAILSESEIEKIRNS